MPSPRPTASAGVPSRVERTGTLEAPSVTRRTRAAQRPVSSTRPISPSELRTGMPAVTPAALPAESVASRRGDWKEEETIRAVVTSIAGLPGEPEQSEEPAVLIVERAPAVELALRLGQLPAQLAILRARLPVIADPLADPAEEADDRAPGVADRGSHVRGGGAQCLESLGVDDRDGEQQHGDEAAGDRDHIADEHAILRPAGESGASSCLAAPLPAPASCLSRLQDAAEDFFFHARARCPARRRSADRPQP